MFNNIAGSRSFNANGTFPITHPPMPIIGTLTLDFVNDNSFVGDAIIKVLGVHTAAGTAPRGTIYQQSDATGDIAANTPVTMDTVNYVRQDGTIVYVKIEGYVSGSCTVYWSWTMG